MNYDALFMKFLGSKKGSMESKSEKIPKFTEHVPHK